MTDQSDADAQANLELTVDIVSAYVGNNTVAAGDLQQLIASVSQALRSLGSAPATPAADPLVPAVAIKRSVTADAIICLEDGKKFKSLKRHLRTAYDLSPDAYRKKWNLPADYPMVAPNYAKARSDLAKTMGLGQKRKQAATKVKPATSGARSKKTRS